MEGERQSCSAAGAGCRRGRIAGGEACSQVETGRQCRTGCLVQIGELMSDLVLHQRAPGRARLRRRDLSYLAHLQLRIF